MALSGEHAATPTEQQETGVPSLQLQHVSLRYGAVQALDDVSFDLAEGGILCLLGSSGSGKSSILRLIAGLEHPASGRIVIRGQLVAGGGQHVPPERRQVGMVFQDFALFPHLTVKANVAFGIRNQSRAHINETVATLLRDVGLTERADRYPHMLSGGERQRVALARALAPRPRILLMDEPFSSLDPRLRDQVREQTIDLLRRTGTMTIVVTHDPAEAMRIADRIGVLAQGRLVQFGTAAELYWRPCSPTMAGIFEHVNTLEGSVDGNALVTPLGVFPPPRFVSPGSVVVCVRPQHIRLETGDAGAPAVVTRVTCVGDDTEVQLRVDDLHLMARVPGNVPFEIGDTPRVSVDSTQLMVFSQRRTPTFAGA